MAASDRDQDEQKPSEQRGGTTPNAAEAREKGSWAGKADEGVVPAELGGSDAPREMLADDPELGSSVLGDDRLRRAGDAERHRPECRRHADAVSDGGPDVPADAEPDLKDVGAAAREAERD